MFSYIVLKLLLLNPFCVYESQCPTPKASIFKRNIVQLSDQPNSASSNPLYKAHIVKQHSYSQGHAELQPFMHGSSSCEVLMENPDLHGHSESLLLIHGSSSCAENSDSQGHLESQPIMHGSSSCAVFMETSLVGTFRITTAYTFRITTAYTFRFTTAYAWLIQLCSSHGDFTRRDIQNHHHLYVQNHNRLYIRNHNRLCMANPAVQ